MSYIITNGTSYCHRTRTQAVEIVTDLDMATRFKDEEAANKLLARATKKLGGFSIQDYAAAEAAAKKPGRKRTRKTAAQQTDGAAQEPRKNRPGKTAAQQADGAAQEPKKNRPGRKRTQTQPAPVQEKEPQTITAEPAAAHETEAAPAAESAAAASQQTAADPARDAAGEETAETKTQRSRRHRGGRRRKNNAGTDKPAEETAAAVEEVKEVKETAEAEPQAQTPKKPVFNFKVEVHSVGTPANRPQQQTAAAQDTAKAEERVEDTDTSVSVEPVQKPEPVNHESPMQKQEAVKPNKPVQKQETVKPEEPVQIHESAGAEKPDESSGAANAEEPVQTPEQTAEEREGRESRTRQTPSRQNGRQNRGRSTEEPDNGPVYEDVFDDAPIVQQRGRGRQNGRSQGNAGTGSARSGSRRSGGQSASSQNAPQSRRTRKSPAVPDGAPDNRRRQFTVQERNLVYNRTEGHCGICGKFIPLEEYTIDHIIPLSKGGTNALDNLQACCGFCNKAKDDSVGDDFFNRIRNIFLYQAELKYGAKKVKKFKKALKELD